MFDFTGANAMCQCTERAVCGGVAVTAHHSHAGQCGTVFGANDVDDALAARHEREKRGRAVLGNVFVQRCDLFFADWIVNTVIATFPACGGRVVVRSGNDGADAPQRSLRLAQTFKCLGAGDFVHQVPVNVKNGSAVFFGADDVFVPDLVVEGASHG